MPNQELTVEQSKDYRYFDSVIRSPEIFASITDDRCTDPKAVSTRALADSGIFFIVRVDGERCGFFAFLKTDSGYEQHTTLTEKCRGLLAIKAGRMAIAAMRAHTTQLESFAYSDMPNTLWYASKLGYSKDGVRENVSRNGKKVQVVNLTLKLEGK